MSSVNSHISESNPQIQTMTTLEDAENTDETHLSEQIA